MSLDSKALKLLQIYKSPKIVNRKDLKIKLTQLTNNYFKPRCEHYMTKTRSLNNRILESSGNNKSIEKEIKFSRNFRFGKTNDYFSHYTDLSAFKVDYASFTKKLENELNEEEINAIKKNKAFYIPNSKLRSKLTIFNEQSLYEILNDEEKKEKEEKKIQRIRKSIIDGCISFKDNHILMSIFREKRDSVFFPNPNIQLYKTSIGEENKTKTNLNDISTNSKTLKYYSEKEEKLDEIKWKILNGVKKMRSEENKLSNIRKKNELFFRNAEKTSAKEINRILNDNKNDNMFEQMKKNNRYIQHLKAMSCVENEDVSLPLIKTNNRQKSKDKRINLFKKPKEDNEKINIKLKKNSKVRKFIVEDNDQLINSINRKIKLMYDQNRKIDKQEF